MILKRSILYGEIYLVDASPHIGHEFYGKRPALVVESNDHIQRSNLVTIMPLTSNMHNKLPEDLVITTNKVNNLIADSVIKVYNIHSYDYSRFIQRIGAVDKMVMEKVRGYLMRHFGLK